MYVAPDVPIERIVADLFHHAWARPTDVELMARYVFERFPARRRGTSARTMPPPSKRALRAARRIYTAGIVEWPTSIAVKLEFGRFLWFYARDSVAANELMRGVSSPQLGLDAQFYVYSWQRMLAQLRQSEDLGEAAMNMIVLLEYRRNFTRAVHHHHAAIRLLLKLWGLLVTDVSEG